LRNHPIFELENTHNREERENEAEDPTPPYNVAKRHRRTSMGRPTLHMTARRVGAETQRPLPRGSGQVAVAERLFRLPRVNELLHSLEKQAPRGEEPALGEMRIMSSGNHRVDRPGRPRNRAVDSAAARALAELQPAPPARRVADRKGDRLLHRRSTVQGVQGRWRGGVVNEPQKRNFFGAML
jgi:hypothetical protein